MIRRQRAKVSIDNEVVPVLSMNVDKNLLSMSLAATERTLQVLGEHRASNPSKITFRYARKNAVTHQRTGTLYEINRLEDFQGLWAIEMIWALN